MSKSEPSSTQVFNVLVVENDARWQKRLGKQIRGACARVEIHFAENYDRAMDAFDSETTWHLITLDIGMPFDDDSKDDDEQEYGIQLAVRAGKENRRYIVVSQTITTPSHAVDDLREYHGARRFFSKFHLDFERFRACVRELLTEDEPDRPPASTSSAQVTISYGADCFVIKADGKPDFSVAPDLWAFVALYAQKVTTNGTYEPLPWRDLNTAIKRTVAEPEGGKSSGRLRKALSNLNKDLDEKWGTPPDGEKWIVTIRGYGAHLNKSIKWSIDDRARAALRSVFSVNVDPRTMEQNTPDRGYPLPAQPKRKPSTDANDDEM